MRSRRHLGRRLRPESARGAHSSIDRDRPRSISTPTPTRSSTSLLSCCFVRHSLLLRRLLPSFLPSTCQAPALARVCGRFCENSPFEMYRDLSTPATIADTFNARPSRSSDRPKRAGTELPKLLSRITFSPIILPSRSDRSGAIAVPFGWALSLQPSPPDHRSWVRAMSQTGVRGHACSAAPVASYAGAPSRGDTLRAMSSRVAKVFRS